MNADSYSKEKIISGLEYMYNKNIEYDEELELLSSNYSLQILWKFNNVVENGFFSLEINHFTLLNKYSVYCLFCLTSRRQR